MKSINKFLTVGLSALALVACNDLDQQIEGNYATTDQKKDLTEEFPEKLVAAVAGTTAEFSKYMSVYEYHFDFGYPSLMLALDSRGIDMLGCDSGYNWFSWSNDLSDGNVNGRGTNIAWSYMYSQISAANTLLKTVGESNDATMQFYMAQAKAIRAYDYWVLAQLYQFNYVGHESQPCVPIITDKNIDEIAAVGGAKRSTVQEVYTQIMTDLDDAVNYLTAANAAKVTPDAVLDSKPKRLVSLATAYGLRARVNLTMGKYLEAANDAKEAIKAFKGQPSSFETASKPGLWSIDEDNWMWGIAINESDRVVTSGIVNWPSHMGSLCGNSYAEVGAWRQVAKNLFDQIPAKDARKGWWLDSKKKSANLTEAQQAYCKDADMPAYNQVKFAPYQDQLGNTVKGQDIPLMRIEEMYLIQAEGEAMSGNTEGGKQTLTKFVKTYRFKSYACHANTPTDIQDEVWFQRRVELWGEGLSYFDIMRLKKPIDRRGGGWPANWVYNVPAESNVMRYVIPNSELQANPMISAADNNPSSERPLPVTE
ncbi:MAG: RagB/SusD family nutrient uptake outer membrane protein [Muribaculaceae bacterium]|nr:RagB/SusD family nutrient uptake outer membrane protein [Muribaculaceae bacterium]